ncbi:MAG: PQQ-dependent sugar dehydrogenase, partial [Pseudomonadota bacterium]
AGDPGGNAQDTTNLLGTIIRIDVGNGLPYTIPGDNPFAGNPLCDTGSGAADCPEIYAFGLRNPWRFSFDGPSMSLFAGDVGQQSFEEIDRVTLGGNYGWPIREGANCFAATTCTTAGLIDPVHEYGRGVGASVTGGFVYRGTAIPELEGFYIFGDFVSGRVFALDSNAQSLTDATELFDSDIPIASFGRSELDGELFIVGLNGLLYQIVPSTAN